MQGFPTDDVGEPAVTSLCLLSFLATGHLPGERPLLTNLQFRIISDLS
jgi:hypothetical protein